MEIGYKIWLKKEGRKIFGKGPKELLIRVDQLGSLSKAAASMNMSYSKAWNLISNLEKTLGIKVLDKKIGGIDGGSSSLTPEGKNLIKKYDRLEKKIEQIFSQIDLNNI
ncbi:winged helix-turn-helix domain-containing protein [Garciella nitratireducens]|uniref:Molybdate transport system regulatory protein n=1 Tax=Garciella nitratireducens DSM 15102 TaxID=1121911 RepID=A0A1T4NH80_9FIRM|nr:LysR family transcriptional regulator [Garciella nitratireducens]RBP42866.1 molybdate transport system regulatory protein [Garciella nitratireducens]SJZ78426.1 molybdate transport system regulatory protein [Garciella nitratireducens DSM 15102]